ncbi:MAG: MerR family transcriptional regulator [Anaerolinea sp.]|nr:MerR family transcriptional regulator [Anaerolinea sp.]
MQLTFQVGEFAQMAGVTVRTLRFYDQAGLLKPARRGSTRQYRQSDLLRLQQILTLKALGFSLNEIRDLLESPGYDLRRSFEIQRAALQQQIDGLSRALRGLELTLARLDATQQVDWSEIAAIIAAVNTDFKEEWLKRYYDDDQIAGFLAHQPNQAQIEAWTKQWRDLTADYTAKRQLPPDHPDVQALAARQVALVEAFTQGDQRITESLRAMYANFEDIPAEYRLFDRDLLDYMGEAVRIFQERRGQADL